MYNHKLTLINCPVAAHVSNGAAMEAQEAKEPTSGPLQHPEPCPHPQPDNKVKAFCLNC